MADDTLDLDSAVYSARFAESWREYLLKLKARAPTIRFLSHHWANYVQESSDPPENLVLEALFDSKTAHICSQRKRKQHFHLSLSCVAIRASRSVTVP